MNKKYKKLIASIILDVIGFFTIIPLDIVWAPISGYLMTKMYKGNKGKIAGIVSFLEEIIPFADIIPTFTIMWLYTYVFDKEKNSKDDEIVIEAQFSSLNKNPKPNLPKNFFSKAQKNLNCPNNQPTIGNVS